MDATKKSTGNSTQESKTTKLPMRAKAQREEMELTDESGNAIKVQPAETEQLNNSLRDAGEMPLKGSMKVAGGDQSIARHFSKNQTFKNDLFMAEPAVCTKRDAIAKTFYGRKHKHFFRARRPNGALEKTSTPVANHFHYCTTRDPETGKEYIQEIAHPETGERVTVPGAVCGPPMREVEFKDRDGRMRKRIERVFFWGEKDGQSVKIYDNHVHDLTYQRSEELSLHALAEQRQKAKNEIMSEVGPEARFVGHSAPRLTNEDGVDMSSTDVGSKSTY